jgi:hypothetical protein
VKILLLLAALLLLTACAPKERGQCAAWGCHEISSAPLAWTRPGGDARGMDLLSTGDLCPRHAAKLPFVLVTRCFVFFAVFPAILLGWVSFRVLNLLDQHGPGLPRWVGDRPAKPLLFGAPPLLSLAWLGFFALRAW